MSSSRSPARRPSSSKRTVSTAAALALEPDAVLLDGLLRGVLPGPAVDDALAAARADRAAQVGLLEAPADLGGERLAVAGRHDQAVSPSLPMTSGSAPPVVATSGVPQAMASMAGSEKPS